MKLPLSPLYCAIMLVVPLLVPSLASADDTAKKEEDKVFTLGQITVTGKRDNEEAIATSTVDRVQLEDFSKDGLTEALNLVPGVVVTPGSGQRNEASINIRGFDAWRVPITMDGIRLYLPYDNRIDIGRFLTPDLSEIQVSKGYVSVLNGPGGMGGTINLVTRKPTEALEAEARLSMLMGEGGQRNGLTFYGNVGGKQQDWYWQASFEQREIDHWRVSSNFHSTPRENGGDRDRSNTRDWRVNLKAGYTPNGTDEYSINFVKQEGKKPGIFSTLRNTNDWEWPEWDVWSLYWLSHTQLSDTTYLKTKAYYNQFDNQLMMHNFNQLSVYDDNSYGLSVETGTTYFTKHTLKAALHYRRDNHTAWNEYYSPPASKEPKQDAQEDTWSLGIEDTWHITPKWDLIGGISYDYRDTKKVEYYRSGMGLLEHDTKDKSAWNYQGAVVYRYSDTGKANFSVSRRVSMPTMFHRFSSRFGSAYQNPGLKPEKALNFELAISDKLSDNWFGEAAIFHNKIDDLMQSVAVPSDPGRSTNENVGTGTFRGLELSLNGFLTPTLEVGANYTYTDVDIHLSSKSTGSSTLTKSGVPRHKGMLYAKWFPTPKWSFIPYIESSDSRWSDPATGSDMVKTGSYTLVNFKLGYQVTRDFDISLTARNLLNRNYELTQGYPQEGRNFMLTARFKY